MRAETNAARKLTARQRQRLLAKPVTIMNYRICHAQKRWGGVFVHDYFGEGGIHKVRTKAQAAASAQDGERVTIYQGAITAVDYETWERIADNDANL